MSALVVTDGELNAALAAYHQDPEAGERLRRSRDGWDERRLMLRALNASREARAQATDDDEKDECGISRRELASALACYHGEPDALADLERSDTSQLGALGVLRMAEALVAAECARVAAETIEMVTRTPREGYWLDNGAGKFEMVPLERIAECMKQHPTSDNAVFQADGTVHQEHVEVRWPEPPESEPKATKSTPDAWTIRKPGILRLNGTSIEIRFIMDHESEINFHIFWHGKPMDKEFDLAMAKHRVIVLRNDLREMGLEP